MIPGGGQYLVCVEGKVVQTLLWAMHKRICTEPVHTGTGRNNPQQQNDESVVGGCSSLVYGEEGGAHENFYFGSGSISARHSQQITREPPFNI
jgi:hypothetical protein